MTQPDTYHILNGDALLPAFRSLNVPGSVIIIREAFIEGPLQPDIDDEFWNRRAEFIKKRFDEPRENYRKKVISEFNKLKNITNPAIINLWFEYDLFCQINCWSALHVLQPLLRGHECYLVYPTIERENRWIGFGNSKKEDLQLALARKIVVSPPDLHLAEKLWKAIASHDLESLKNLSEIHSKAFPGLKEVCTAHIERFPSPGLKSRPERSIEEIIKKDCTVDFFKVFSEFSKKEGVYGFGDMQFKVLFERVANVL